MSSLQNNMKFISSSDCTLSDQCVIPQPSGVSSEININSVVNESFQSDGLKGCLNFDYLKDHFVNGVKGETINRESRDCDESHLDGLVLRKKAGNDSAEFQVDSGILGKSSLSENFVENSSFEPSTVATLTTDKLLSTMQILINTNQGQKLVEISPSALNSHANGVPCTSDTVAVNNLKESADSGEISIIELDPNTASLAIPDENPTDEEVNHSIETINHEVQTENAQKIVEFVNKLSSCGRSKKKTNGWACPMDGCGQVHDRAYKLKVHLINHAEKRPFKCTFDGCDWSFKTAYRLHRHLKTHLGDKNYECDIDGCKCRFTTIYNLNAHKKRHIKPNTVVCPADGCDQTFSSRRKMELHLRIHKDVEAPYKCPVCGNDYYSANAIASHFRIHQYSEEDLKCPFQNCGKIFDKVCRLKLHIRSHTGDRPYVCDVEGCGWSFISASKLSRHMQKHTGERKYACPVVNCGKSFMRPEHLKDHVIIHSGDKPFVCPHENCDARFTAKSSLYVHLKKHNGSVEKLLYPCTIDSCTKKYNCKATLRIHMHKKHELLNKKTRKINKLISKELHTISDSEIDIPLDLSSMSKTYNLNIEEVVVNPDEVLLNSRPSTLDTAVSTNAGTSVISSSHLVINTDVHNLNNTGYPTMLVSPSKISVSPSELELLAFSRVLQENNSGSARTDFCSNHILSTRAKKWWLLQQELKSNIPLISENRHETSISSQQGIVLGSSDVMLASSLTFPDQTSTDNFIQTHFLQDDPSSTVSIYQEDNMLNTGTNCLVSELSIPVSLLSEPSDSSAMEQSTAATSFIDTQDDVEFSSTTIHLEGLE